MGFLDNAQDAITSAQDRIHESELTYADSREEWDAAMDEMDESMVGGSHPLTQGIGGPATKGASLITNSGKFLSKAPKVLSGRKAVSVGKIKNAGKSVDALPRLASWGTSGESPLDVAQQTKDDVEQAIDAAKNWEAPDVDIPTPGDEPKPNRGPPVALLAAAAAAIGGAILVAQEVSEA